MLCWQYTGLFAPKVNLTTKNKSLWLWSSSILATAAVSLTMGSAYNFRPFNDTGLLPGFILLLSGGILLLAALYRSRIPACWPRVAAQMPGTKPGFVDALKITAGVALLLALTVSNGNPKPAWLPRGSHNIQFALLGGGILLLTWGLSGLNRADMTHVWRIFRGRELPPLLFITLLAFALQFWMLEDAVHIFVDEFHTINGVIDLWTRNDIRILMPFSNMAAFPWLFPYFESWGMVLFGHTYTGVRFASVIFGTLTVPALYTLAKALFDRPTALIAALFLAVFPPFIHLSRLALVNVADPFWGTWMLAFLAWGVRSGHRANFVLAGVCLGMTQYFYEGGKLLFPALVGGWMLVMLLTIRKRNLMRNFAWMLITALLVALPLYLTLASWNLPFVPRLNVYGDNSLDWGAVFTLNDDGAALQNYLTHHLLPPLLHIIQRPDSSQFYYGGETALILTYMLPCFFLGIFHAVWRWRTAGTLLLLWLGLTIMGNSLLEAFTNTWSARFMIVFPALALLMALGLRYTLPLFMIDVRRIRPHGALIQGRWSCIGLACAAVVLAIPQPVYYFRDHLPVYNIQVRPFRDHIDAFDRARSLPPDTTLIFVTDDAVFTEHFVTLSALWQFHPLVLVVKPAEFTRDYVTNLPFGGYGFYIDPDNSEVLKMLRALYGLDAPGGPFFSPYHVPPERQYALYYLPPRQS